MLTTLFSESSAPFEAAFHKWALSMQSIQEVKGFVWEGVPPTQEELEKCSAWVDNYTTENAEHFSPELQSSLKSALSKFHSEESPVFLPADADEKDSAPAELEDHQGYVEQLFTSLNSTSSPIPLFFDENRIQQYLIEELQRLMRLSNFETANKMIAVLKSDESIDFKINKIIEIANEKNSKDLDHSFRTALKECSKLTKKTDLTLTFTKFLKKYRRLDESVDNLELYIQRSMLRGEENILSLSPSFPKQAESDFVIQFKRWVNLYARNNGADKKTILADLAYIKFSHAPTQNELELCHEYMVPIAFKLKQNAEVFQNFLSTTASQFNINPDFDSSLGAKRESIGLSHGYEFEANNMHDSAIIDDFYNTARWRTSEESESQSDVKQASNSPENYEDAFIYALMNDSASPEIFNQEQMESYLKDNKKNKSSYLNSLDLKNVFLKYLYDEKKLDMQAIQRYVLIRESLQPLRKYLADNIVEDLFASSRLPDFSVKGVEYVDSLIGAIKSFEEKLEEHKEVIQRAKTNATQEASKSFGGLFSLWIKLASINGNRVSSEDLSYIGASLGTPEELEKCWIDIKAYRKVSGDKAEIFVHFLANAVLASEASLVSQDLKVNVANITRQYLLISENLRSGLLKNGEGASCEEFLARKKEDLKNTLLSASFKSQFILYANFYIATGEWDVLSFIDAGYTEADVQKCRSIVDKMPPLPSRVEAKQLLINVLNTLEEKLSALLSLNILSWGSQEIASHFPDKENVSVRGAFENRKAAIVRVFINAFQAWRTEKATNLLQAEVQFDALWADYISKLPEDVKASADEPAMKRAAQVVWISNFIAGKNLTEIEKAALLAYLPVMQQKNKDGEQLARIDHALWKLKSDSQGLLLADEEQGYSDVQSIVIAELGKNSRSEFESFIELVPTIANFDSHSIGALLLNFAESMQENIQYFLRDNEVMQAIHASGLTVFSVVRNLADVYCELLVAYIAEKRPELMRGDSRELTPLNLIIKFLGNICNEIKFPDHCSDIEKEFSLIIEKIINDIDLLETSPIIVPQPQDHHESVQQSRLFQGLVSIRENINDRQAFLESNGFPGALNILDLISKNFTLNADLSNFSPAESATVILKKVLLQNAGFFRALSREKNGDPVCVRATHRLLNAFFNTCAGVEQTEVTKSILNKKEEIQALITFNDNSPLAALLSSEELEEKIFSANLSVVLTNSDLSTADKAFSQAVTAVAILWQHPSISNEIAAEAADMDVFKAITVNDKITHLRLAVKWIQEKDLALKVNKYYAKNAERLNQATSAENRVKNLQVLIPAFLSQDISPSRAFNKGAIHIDEFLVPESVKNIFSKVSESIKNCSNFEEEIALIVQKVLKAMLQDFKTLFPDPAILPVVKDSAGKSLSAKEIILQLAALQLSYLGKIYQKQANLNGRICGLISGRAEGIVNLRLMKEGSEENNVYSNIESEIDNVMASGQPIKYETFGVDQGRNFSDYIFPANSNIASLANTQASQLYKDSPQEEKNRKIVEAEASALHKLMLDTFSLYGKVPPINFRTALQGIDAVFSTCMNNLCIAARDRKESELEGLVDEMVQASVDSKPEEYQKDTMSYNGILSKALRDGSDLPVYFNPKRIEQYLEKTIDGLITNTYGEAADKAPMLKLLYSNLPLFIKLRMIGQIALGNTLYLPPVIDIGGVHSWQAQKIYKQLSCFSEVTEENMLEKFTEFLKASGAPVANKVKNIEHVIQRSALLSMEMSVRKSSVLDSVPLSNSEPPEEVFQFIQETEDRFDDVKEAGRSKQAQDSFISLIENRLALSVKSGVPMMTDWQYYLPADSIPENEAEFVGFINKLLTNTKLNKRFAELITAERQTEFVVALTQTLLNCQSFIHPGSREEKNVLASVGEMFIRINVLQPTSEFKAASDNSGWLEYSDADADADADADEYFQDIIEKIFKSHNVEQQLWVCLQDILKLAVDQGTTTESGAVDLNVILDRLAVFYHRQAAPTATGQFSAVLIEKAIYFLSHLDQPFDGFLESLNEKIVAACQEESQEKRKDFGLLAKDGKEYTLTALALARLSQPEIARQEETLDFVLALNRKPHEDKFKEKSLSNKVDSALRVKTLVNIWFSLAKIDYKTGCSNFNDEAVLSVAAHDGDLFFVVKEIVRHAGVASRHHELSVILPVVFKTMLSVINHGATKDSVEKIVNFLAGEYGKLTNSSEIRKIILETLALAVGAYKEAETCVAKELSLLARDRSNPRLSELIVLLPDTFEKKNTESIGPDQNAPLSNAVSQVDDEKEISKNEINNPHLVQFSISSGQLENKEEIAQSNTKEIQSKVTFNKDTEIFKDEADHSDLYRKNDDAWPEEFRQSITQKPKTVRSLKFSEKDEHGFGEERIQQYLIEKIEALANTIAPGEISGKKQMLEILGKNLSLTTKLNLIGHIAQGKVNDATVGNQYGLRRNSEVQKLYADLCVFSGITEVEQVIPTFTIFLKNQLPFNQALVGIKNIEHHIQRYELIREGLRFIPKENFPSGSTIKLRFEAWVYNDKNLRDSSDVCQAIDLFRQMLHDHRNEIDIALSKTSENVEKLRSGARETITREVAPPSRNNGSVPDLESDQSFSQLFMKWVNFSIKTGESLKQDDLFLIGMQVTKYQTKICYQKIQENTALQPLQKQAFIEALRACHAKISGKPKEEALDEWGAIVNEYVSVKNFTALNFSTIYSLPDLLKYYEGANLKTNSYIPQEISDQIDSICTKNYLTNLRNALSKFKTFYEAYSPKALFYGNKPTGIQEIINMIDNKKPAVEIMLRLRDIAVERLDRKVSVDTRQDETRNMYEAVKAFFEIPEGQAPQKNARTAQVLLTSIEAAAPPIKNQLLVVT